MQSSEHTGSPPQMGHVESRLAAAGWGTFFLWVGISLWAGFSWGIGLLGVGAITLVAQAFRRYFGLPLEGFWLVIGSLFAVGGVWELSGTTIALVPVLLVVAGALLLYSAFASHRPHQSAH